MIKKPPPFKGLNIRISIIIPIKGRGLLIRGLASRTPRKLQQASLESVPRLSPPMATARENAKHTRVPTCFYYTVVTTYLEGHGDSISRLIRGITGVVISLMGVINVLTRST